MKVSDVSSMPKNLLGNYASFHSELWGRLPVALKDASSRTWASKKFTWPSRIFKVTTEMRSEGHRRRSGNFWKLKTSIYRFKQNVLQVKGKVVSVPNQVLRHEAVLGNGGIVPRISYLGTRWRRVVSFTPRPLYPREKEPPLSIGYEARWSPRIGPDAMAKR